MNKLIERRKVITENRGDIPLDDFKKKLNSAVSGAINFKEAVNFRVRLEIDLFNDGEGECEVPIISLVYSSPRTDAEQKRHEGHMKRLTEEQEEKDKEIFERIKKHYAWAK